MHIKNILIIILFSLIFSSCTPEKNLKRDINQTKINQTQNTMNTNSNLSSQEQDINLKNRIIILETNFGTLNVKMLDNIAPKTTENFIRLSLQNYYNGTKFHRIVKSDHFSIIQGGDPTATGRGGQSYWGEKFEDEVYDKNGKLPEEYSQFNGQYAIYQKGYLAMANAGPNTNGSQFFIMLDNTYLPPDYTIFGKINEEDFIVLDKILAEVDSSSPTGDGMPNKEIKIISSKLAK